MKALLVDRKDFTKRLEIKSFLPVIYVGVSQNEFLARCVCGNETIKKLPQHCYEKLEFIFSHEQNDEKHGMVLVYKEKEVA
jgi:hypothetical protein